MDDLQRMRVTSQSRLLLGEVADSATHTSTKRLTGWRLRSLGHIRSEQDGAATMRRSEEQEEPLRCGGVKIKKVPLRVRTETALFIRLVYGTPRGPAVCLRPRPLNSSTLVAHQRSLRSAPAHACV